jgi:hypothetical protein
MTEHDVLLFRSLIENVQTTRALKELGTRIKADRLMETATQEQADAIRAAYVERMTYLTGITTRASVLADQLLAELSDADIERVLSADNKVEELLKLLPTPNLSPISTTPSPEEAA